MSTILVPIQLWLIFSKVNIIMFVIPNIMFYEYTSIVNQTEVFHFKINYYSRIQPTKAVETFQSRGRAIFMV